MTNKSNKTKVSKNSDRLRPLRRDFEVIRHFDPSTNTTIASPVHSAIPLINVSDEEEPEVANLRDPKRNVSVPRRQGVKQQTRINKDLTQFNPEARNIKNLLTFGSSSSSSLEPAFEKLINQVKPKPKTLSNPRGIKERSKALKSAVEKSSLNSASSSFKSSTDPALVQRELKLKSLKQEILANKKNIPKLRHKLGIQNVINKNDPLVEDLKAEIFNAKTHNVLHKKVLITELRSEIAQYKQFSKFQVYNSYEGLQRQNHDRSKEMNDAVGRDANRNLEPSENRIVRNRGSAGSKDDSSCGSKNNSSRRSKASSRGASATDQESSLDPDPADRFSNSNIDTSDCSNVPDRSREVSAAESMNDDVIKKKIQEANQLIRRVKKALVKIRAIKPCDGCVGSAEAKSSTTDIEETIRNLREDTEKLIIEDDNKGSKSISRPGLTNCLTCSKSTTNKALQKKEGASNAPEMVPSDPQLIDIAPTFNADLCVVAARNSIECSDKYLPPNIDFDRPKTRRNEAEEDLSEQLKKDKFRSSPEMGRLEVTSSFEELQAKLQTISESTESSRSTPRQKSDSSAINKASVGCNTELTQTENKNTQVAPCQMSTGVCCSCVKEDKQVQTSKAETTDVATKTVGPPEQVLERPPLKIHNLHPEEVVPVDVRRKCSSCKVESLPVVELSPQKFVCEICKDRLQQENLQGISVGSKAEKLKRLKVQMLPAIIIKPALILIQTLNLSIDQSGQSENRVRNTENLLFVETKRSVESRMSFETVLPPRVIIGNDDEEFEVEEVNIEPQQQFFEEQAENYVEDTTNQELLIEEQPLPKVQWKTFESESERKSSSEDTMASPKTSSFPLEKLNNIDIKEVVINEINDDEGFLSRARFSADPSVVNEAALSLDNEEEIRKKLWYKSYHIYDNPNLHDPGELDQKSLSKLSQMNVDFYKTFVNPDSQISDEHFASSLSKNKLMGFESKNIQCDQEMIFAAQEPVQLEEFKTINMESLDPRVDDGVCNVDYMESEVTVLRLIPEKLESDPSSPSFHSKVVLLGSYADKEATSSPSEITLTISYTLSSEEKVDEETALNKDDEKEPTNKVREGALTPEAEPEVKNKILKVKDQEAIDKLRDKYQTINVNSESFTPFPVDNSETDETVHTFIKGLTNSEDWQDGHRRDSYKRKDSENKPTVNYMLNKPLPLTIPYQHLEVGSNGRYKDEEHLFTQVPHPVIVNSGHKSLEDFKYPTPSVFEHRDLEVARDKFSIISRHRLHRYSPDTSNSDTVTTNSISEGEILCKHIVSNGEIHVCRRRPQCPPRLQRNILTRKRMSLNRGSPQNLCPPPPRKIDVNDPKVTVEQRRNYFNNWVTYYVKPQDLNQSTTSSSCSNNK